MITPSLRATCYASALLASAALMPFAHSAPASERLETPELTRAESCMVDVLKTMPGFMDAHVEPRLNGSDDDAVIIYTLRYPTGQVFHRMVELYEDGPMTFSIRMPEGLTPALYHGWRSCGVVTMQPVSP